MSEKKSGGTSKQTGRGGDGERGRRGEGETRRRGELKFQPKFPSPGNREQESVLTAVATALIV
ncbi:MAG: hypothetical protein F6K58_04230 [Symploca sp. SIO2E9]|nr:hypothetical protein [Symploca sp. SIO2E9]